MTNTTNKAKLCFHQGWTDIINCLPLINYYSKVCGSLEVVIRDDSSALIDFYLGQFDNVKALYLQKNYIEKHLHAPYNHTGYAPLLFFGVHDTHRDSTDAYRNFFRNGCGGVFFVEKFYTCYGIPYEERVNSFNIKRDEKLENETYKKIIGDYEGEYIVVHEDTERGLSLGADNGDVRIVKLNGASDIFFDYIKVLQNAKSIHLIDSVWATVCYLLDAKYGLLKDIVVNVHCLRGYKEMFTKPIELPNWKIN